jgi:hypothetical protein
MRWRWDEMGAKALLWVPGVMPAFPSSKLLWKAMTAGLVVS